MNYPLLLSFIGYLKEVNSFVDYTLGRHTNDKINFSLVLIDEQHPFSPTGPNTANIPYLQSLGRIHNVPHVTDVIKEAELNFIQNPDKKAVLQSYALELKGNVREYPDIHCLDDAIDAANIDDVDTAKFLVSEVLRSANAMSTKFKEGFEELKSRYTLSLPSELSTPKVKTAFEAAERAGFIANTNGSLAWQKSYALLAYFIVRLDISSQLDEIAALLRIEKKKIGNAIRVNRSESRHPRGADVVDSIVESL